MATAPVLREAPGRRIGKPAGSHIDELVALGKAIVLCWKCQPRFNHKKARYYQDRKYPVSFGRCDGCRDIAYQGRLYVSESVLTDPGRILRPGQCWSPL